MANSAPATQSSDGTQLTKPADWALYMVTAALKFSSDNSSQTTYTTPDEGRLDILNTLNWYEAHGEYEWPEFAKLGFDFSQAMRFRRALVNDVFVALQKAGHVKVIGETGVFGTPESNQGANRAKRASGSGGRRMTERKRHCKREDDSDTVVASNDEDKPFWDDDEFLAEVMHELIGRSGADVEGYLNAEKSSDALANIVHDGLVEVWDAPLASHGRLPKELERKQQTWARLQRTPEPGERCGAHGRLPKEPERKQEGWRHGVTPEPGEHRAGPKGERNATMSVPVGH